MSDLRIAALLVSDLHLQAKPPVARSAEPDWFAAMERPLVEIGNLARLYDCPVLYAGDIFDRWHAGPEVINFALRHLPKGYAVPGQHDLPNHDYAQRDRSAYGTLVEAGLLVDVPPGETFYCGREDNKRISITGFPWGYPPKPLNPDARAPGTLAVTIIHKFVWIKGTGYPGAPEEAMASTKALTGYDVAAYGDNHKGFIIPPKKAGDPWVINCGGLMRRKTDERDYRPGIGLLLEDGTVRRYYLNTDEDKMITLTAAEEEISQTLNMSAFVDGLKGLGSGDGLDFETAMERFMDENKTRGDVRTVITEAMG